MELGSRLTDRTKAIVVSRIGRVYPARCRHVRVSRPEGAAFGRAEGTITILVPRAARRPWAAFRDPFRILLRPISTVEADEPGSGTMPCSESFRPRQSSHRSGARLLPGDRANRSENGGRYMAKQALIEKQRKTPKFKVRAYNRCQLCGRQHGYFRFFQICRICLREKAHRGELPGVKKSSW